MLFPGDADLYRENFSDTFRFPPPFTSPKISTGHMLVKSMLIPGESIGLNSLLTKNIVFETHKVFWLSSIQRKFLVDELIIGTDIMSELLD